MKTIEVKILPESEIIEQFSDYQQENIERCHCGSSLFRIYKEPVLEGLYEQNVCAICGDIMGGWLNDFKLTSDDKKSLHDEFPIFNKILEQISKEK